VADPTPAAEPESWDLEAVYDAQLFPLMEKVIAICKEHRIPMVATFTYARDEARDATDHCTTRLAFPGRLVPSHDEAYRAIRRRCSLVAITITSGRKADG
jgi:hypothetical protein